MASADQRTAAEVVMATPQPDDVGANTADRFEWQAAMAAADGFKLYYEALAGGPVLPPSEDRRVLCEYHEDWVVLHDGHAELVSGKHREPSVGAFTTVNQLADDGGVAHLFLRWHALEQKPTCRLATTGGLGPGDPQGMDKLCALLRAVRGAQGTIDIPDTQRSLVDRIYNSIVAQAKKNLPAEWRDGGGTSTDEQKLQVARFLAALTITTSLPLKVHVPHAAPTMYARPVIDRLGLTTPPAAVWEAVMALFRVRMRAAGPVPDLWLPPTLEYAYIGSGTNEPVTDRSLAARIVTVHDIHLAVMTAAANPDAYQPLAPAVRLSRSAIKLAEGKCSENSIERAEMLRSDYLKYWRERMSGDPTAVAELEKLHRLLLRLSDKNTTPELRQAEGWGQELWLRLQDAIDQIPPSAVPAGMDSDLLLGGVAELTNACRIWFSDRFDVSKRINELLQASQGSAA